VDVKQDRFLLGILAFIGLLVVAAVGLFFVRGRTPVYEQENTPQDVLHDYALALQLNDPLRAYSYLAEGDNKPSYDSFHQSLLTRQVDASSAALQIGEVQVLSNGEAWVSVTVQYAGSGLFNEGWSSSDRAALVEQKGAWKITYLPSPYWGWDWYQPTPQPVK
jgi:hypothetical protein